MNELWIRPAQSWKPALDGDEVNPLITVCNQVVGTASKCWTEIDGETVFNPGTAAWVADGLIAWLASHYAPRPASVDELQRRAEAAVRTAQGRGSS